MCISICWTWVVVLSVHFSSVVVGGGTECAFLFCGCGWWYSVCISIRWAWVVALSVHFHVVGVALFLFPSACFSLIELDLGCFSLVQGALGLVWFN